MNSLLQTLYHLPVFRHLLYTLPTEADGSGSVPLSLQRVFYHLQTSASAVSTKHLTQAFGWNNLESWQQHDVQEFSRVLLDAISERVKKTDMEGKPDALFAGKSQMFIECVHVPFKSERVETFLDLAMNVKGCRGLLESFEQYVEVELLDKDNAYRAEQYGLQEARKGSRFLTFPPVLQLQLKRFEYNVERDMNVKVNDRFEFPTHLDLSPYTAHQHPDTPHDPLDPPHYFLHSVLVHSGSGHGGHYYCFIRPFFQGTPYSSSGWYKFDDETVTTATEEEATVGNYGGDVRGNGYFPLGRMSMSNANAYMLVYCRQSVVEAMLAGDGAAKTAEAAADAVEQKESESKEGTLHATEAEDAKGEEKKMDVETDIDIAQVGGAAVVLPEEDTKMGDEGKEGEAATDPTEDSALPVPISVPLPAALLSRFQREEKERAELEERKRRAHLFMELKLISEQHLVELSERTGMGIELRVGREVGEDYVYDTPMQPVKVFKAQTLKEALARRSEWTPEEDWSAMGIALDQQQYWKFTARANDTERPNGHLALSHPEPLVELKFKQLYVRSAQFDDEWKEWSGGRHFTDREVSNEKSEGDRCLLLLKWFDVDHQRMRWMGSIMALKKLRVKDVKAYAYRVMKKRGLWTPKVTAPPSPQRMEIEQKEGQPQSPPVPEAEEKAADEDVVPAMVAWEEENVATDKITPLPDAKTVQEMFLRNGDLLCLQHAYTAEELDDIRQRYTLSKTRQQAVEAPAGTPASTIHYPATAAFFPDAPSYLRYLFNRISVEFRLLPYSPPTKEKPAPANTTFRLELSKTNTFREVVQRLSLHVGIEAGRLQLCRPTPLSRFQPDYVTFERGMGLEPVDGERSAMRLFQMIDTSDAVLYYEVLEFNPMVLHDHYVLPCVYVTRTLVEEHVRVLIKKTATFHDLEGVVRDKVRTLRRERRDKVERERKDQPHDDAAEEMKHAAADVTLGEADDERKEGDDGVSVVPCNFFSLSLVDRELKTYAAAEPVVRFHEFFRIIKSIELVVEEQTEEQIQAEQQAEEVKQQSERAREQRRAARVAESGASEDSSDDDDSEPESPTSPLASSLYVYRFVPTASTMYRLYSHPFTLMVPGGCLVSQLFGVLQRRLGDAARFKVGWLTVTGWMECKADSDDAERDVIDFMHRQKIGGIGVYDADHAKADKAASAHGALPTLAGRPSLWRANNNTAVKIYQS